MFHASRYQCESNAQWGKHAEVTPGDWANYPVIIQDSYRLGQTIVYGTVSSGWMSPNTNVTNYTMFEEVL